MARPQKRGIDYFPFDVGFFDSKPIKVLKGRYGTDGITLYLYILCEIYKENGYYLQIDDDFNYVTASDIGMEDSKIGQILNFLCKRSLLDGTLFASDKVLTSHGIQSRYQEAVRTRASKTPVMVIKKYWVLDDSETLPFIKFINSCDSSKKNVHSSEKNDGFYEEKHHKVKESKGNKSKGNNHMHGADAAADVPPVVSLILNDKSLYCISQPQIDHWKELYPAVDVLQELRKMQGWIESNPAKRKTKNGIERFITGWLAKEQDKGGVKSSVQDKPKSRYDYEEIERRTFMNVTKGAGHGGP